MKENGSSIDLGLLLVLALVAQATAHVDCDSCQAYGTHYLGNARNGGVEAMDHDGDEEAINCGVVREYLAVSRS